MYSQKVMEHFLNPRNVGEIEGANAVAEVGNTSCGDIMKMYLNIEDGIIKDAKFRTYGCCAAIASSSVITEMIKGMSIKQALELKNSDVIEALDGLPPVKAHCSVLAEQAVREAIEAYNKGGAEK